MIYLASVLPLLALFFISNKLALNEMSNQKQSSLTAYLETNKSLLEDEVDRIYMAEYALIINDINIIDLSYRYGSMRGYELGTVVSSIHESLYYLKNTSSLIENVHLYIENIDRKLSTNEYYSDNLSDDEKLLYTLDTQYHQLMKYNDQSMYVVNQMNIQRRHSPYYLFCELKQDAIINLFSKVEENVYTIFYSDNLILSNGDNLINENLIEYLNNENIQNSQLYTDNFEFGKTKYHIVAEHSESLNGTFIVYAPESVIIGSLKKYTAFIYILAILAAIIILILIISVYHMVKEPFEKLIKMFHKVEEGSLDIEIEYEPNNEFGDLLHSFNFMVNKLKNSIHQIYEKNASLKIAELKQLQAQISPHFLYNSFNIIAHSIQPDNETALSMSRALSKYFKYITQNNKQDDTLENEFEFAKTYLDIQKARFGEKIEICMDMIDTELGMLEVPRMIIQPLIENSYKHAFSKISSGGKLIIGWEKSGNTLKIIIEDNGPGLETQELELLRNTIESTENMEHNGLCNVHQRIKIKYQDSYGLRIYSEKNKFFRNEVIIPINPQEERNNQDYV